MAGKLMPPAQQTLSNTNSGNQATSQETGCILPNQDKRQRKKKSYLVETPASDSANPFEATAAGAGIEINMLLTKFADVLSRRAAEDALQMNELECMLIEARNLESYLREKKSRLRQTLAVISDKLQI
ncbi:uncharacterized protein [Nothobranchius furzeri]|uniref:Testis-expressed sequence 12 protein n=2 Tax=Nothobranchius furzeri TaxID=105023 RepID=A0A1A8AS89_NOTFU|nr:transcript variant X2 [Nothobranchius furzeri]KAF7219297.1 transcript variant X1 [Nothobranchius furzeri]